MKEYHGNVYIWEIIQCIEDFSGTEWGALLKCLCKNEAMTKNVTIFELVSKKKPDSILHYWVGEEADARMICFRKEIVPISFDDLWSRMMLQTN